MAKWTDKEAAIKALERGGRVDPNDLIKAARNPDHPCHGDFTWDVDQAASERWRDQARYLIRQCKFEVLVEDHGPRSVTYYVSEAGETDVFQSLPKMRSATTVSDVFDSELASLQGVLARVLGIAEAKRAVIGDEAVKSLRQMSNTLAKMRADK